MPRELHPKRRHWPEWVRVYAETVALPAYATIDYAAKKFVEAERAVRGEANARYIVAGDSMWLVVREGESFRGYILSGTYEPLLLHHFDGRLRVIGRNREGARPWLRQVRTAINTAFGLEVRT